MVYDNKTGFLINEGDHNKWIEKLSLLINDKELSQKIGDEAQKFVIEKFNWDYCCKTICKRDRILFKRKCDRKNLKKTLNANNFRIIFK